MQQDDGNTSSAPIEAVTSSVTALELPSIGGLVNSNEQNIPATEDNHHQDTQEQQSQSILEELQTDLKKIFSDCESILSSTRIDRSQLLSISYAIESYKSKKDDFESLDYSSTLESESKSIKPESTQQQQQSHQPSTSSSPSTNNTNPAQSSPNQLVFSEKQVIRLLVLTGTDQSRLSKSYICAHVWSDLFESRIVDMSCIESIRVLVNLINMLSNLLQLLPGINVCTRVSAIIHESVDYLLTQGDLGPAYNEFLEKLKSNPLVSESRVTKSLENHSKRIAGFAASDDINEKIQAVNLIFDLLSDCMSFEQQIQFFASTITPTLKDLVRIPITLTNTANKTDENVKDLLILLSKLVLALLVNPTLDIDINPQDIRRFYDSTKWFEYVKLAKDTPSRAESASHTQENQQKQQSQQTNTTATANTKRTTIGNIVKYEINGIKEIMSRSQKIYSNIALIVNALLLFPADNEIMRFSLQILILLFKIFVEFRENLRVPLLTVLQNIAALTQNPNNNNNNNNNSSKGDAQEHAAIFLYELMQKEEYASAPSAQPLIAAIKQNGEIVQALITKSPFYSDRYITPTQWNKSILKLEDLIIHKTFAIQERIEAEKGHTFYIEINTSWSIIYVGFATHSHDIKVHLNKVEDITDSDSSEPASSKQSTATPYRILSERVNCEQDPYHIVALVENPGIYSVTFDNSYSWFNSKQLRYRSLSLSPLNTHADSLQRHLLYTPLHFDCLNLSLFKKFDANWCELHVLSHSLEIDITTADKQNLRDVITSHDLARANDTILKRFPKFSKADYFSILVIYESQAWTEIIALYAQKLIGERVLSRTETDQRRTSRDFQLSLFQRLLQEKLAFLTQFKTLSIEAVEDISYFWFKQAPYILAQQQQQLQSGEAITETDKSSEEGQQQQKQQSNSVPATEQVVLIVKCNPVTKIFAMKLFSEGQLHGVKLEDLDEELFSLCEVLLSEKNPEEYFAGFCEFTKAFLLAHESHGITKLVLFLDPSNLFWNQQRLKQLESFLHTQLTNLPRIPQLIMSSI